MDPNETLKLILEAIQEEDYEAAFHHTQDLKTWMSKGGRVPEAFGFTGLLPQYWCVVTMKLMKALSLGKGDQ